MSWRGSDARTPPAAPLLSSAPPNGFGTARSTSATLSRGSSGGQSASTYLAKHIAANQPNSKGNGEAATSMRSVRAGDEASSSSRSSTTRSSESSQARSTAERHRSSVDSKMTGVDNDEDGERNGATRSRSSSAETLVSSGKRQRVQDDAGGGGGRFDIRDKQSWTTSSSSPAAPSPATAPIAPTSILTIPVQGTLLSSSSASLPLSPPPPPASRISKRSSWFGLIPPAAIPAAPALPLPATTLPVSKFHGISSLDPEDPAPRIVHPDFSDRNMASAPTPSAGSSAAAAVQASEPSPIPLRSWLSSITLSRSAVAASSASTLSRTSMDDQLFVPPRPSNDASDGARRSTDLSRNDVALSESGTAPALDTPSSSVNHASKSTDPGIWWNPFAIAITSPSPTPTPLPSSPLPAATVPLPASVFPAASSSRSSSLKEGSSSTVVDSAVDANHSKSWMRTLWGSAENGSRSRPPSIAPSIIDTPPPAVVSPSPILLDSANRLHPPSSPASGPSSLSSTIPPLISNGYQTLRSRASWALFGSPSPAMQHPESTSSSAVLASSIVDAPANERHQHRPRSITPSMTSTTSSAPNSPLLGPTHVTSKPLTGSIHSGNIRSSTAELNTALDNLVLPSFEDTFDRAPRSFPMPTSSLTKAVSAVTAYIFSQPPEATTRAAEVQRERRAVRSDPAEKLPKSLTVMGFRKKDVKRVVTIGVHGWFPNPRLKSVFGEPTGTSVKFSSMMHDAVQAFLESHDYTSFNIQAIALEGDGLVSDRVEMLFSALVARTEWIESIKKADVIFLATHSQGSIVSTHLLRRIIEKLVSNGTKISLLAMCAITQGPFVYLSQSYALSPYFTYLESAAARELFEFQDPNSLVSKSFLSSLRMILDHGVKVTVIGSINDQVVPLYSALFCGVNHPGILRAVYIDGTAFRTSDFLSNLVVFAMRLRNAGLGDHDLIYNISSACAGALTGVGHSKIYEEVEVYNLAARYHFESTLLTEAPTRLVVPPLLRADASGPSPSLAATLVMSFDPTERQNPYLLTWSMRGIVEDAMVRELFGKELTVLREAFEIWKPATKVLKEVKLKLEGIRMLPRAKKEGKL